MTDMETTFLRTAITEVLPDLPEVTKGILEETLQSLGVEAYDDFRFIQESDLLSALRPIQARKVLVAWKRRCKSFIAEQNATTSASSKPKKSLKYKNIHIVLLTILFVFIKRSKKLQISKSTPKGDILFFLKIAFQELQRTARLDYKVVFLYL